MDRQLRKIVTAQAARHHLLDEIPRLQRSLRRAMPPARRFQISQTLLEDHERVRQLNHRIFMLFTVPELEREDAQRSS